MEPAIEVRGLRKSYGSFQAVRGLDFHVEQGEILAFLGPNGAGKTTTVEILEGHRSRDGGEVWVLGQDPWTAPLSWRERVGIVPQNSDLPPGLSARETLQMYAGYYSKPRRPEEVLEVVGLDAKQDSNSRALSGGQQRRLDLALALIGDPELVFLDEPTTGFDPSARRESWDMIDALRTLGRTVLLTTHYMDEAEILADRIVVVAAGQAVAEGTADELARQVGATTTISWKPDRRFRGVPGGLGVEIAADGRAVVNTDRPLPVLNALTEWALNGGHGLNDLKVAKPTLEDIYLSLISGSTPVSADPDRQPPRPGAENPAHV